MRLPRILDETYRVAWGDLCYFKENFVSIMVSCLVGPLLYLFAFGYGLGSNMPSGVDDYLLFIVPGIVSMATLSATFGFISTKILIQKLFYSSFEELMLCPIRPSSIVLGKAFVGLLRGICSCSIILITGMLIAPGIHITALLILLILISSLTFSLLGILAGLLAKKHHSLTVFSGHVITPMTFLCGTIFSISAVPEVFGYAIRCLPLTQPTEAIRAVMLDSPLPWVSIGLMLIYCMVFFFADYHIIKNGKY